MLADGAAVDAVYARPGRAARRSASGERLRGRLDRGAGHAPCPRRCRPAAGAGLLDTPVSGSVGLAESGKLTIMVGGAAADLERARPILEALAGTVFHLGPLGTGAAMKLAVNTLIFGLNQAVAEGLSLAEAAGIERPRRLRRPDRQRRRGAARRLQARRVPRARDDAGRVLARPRGQGPAAHRGPRRGRRRGHAAGAHEPARHRSGRRGRAAATATSPPSRVPRGPPPSEAEEDRADRPPGRGRPARRPSTRDRRSSTEEAAMSERTLIKDAIVLTSRPRHRGVAAREHPDRGRQDRGRRAERDRRRREGHRRDRRHRHPGLHRHPPPHLGDVDPDLRAGLRADHLLRVHPRQVRAALPPGRRAGREPLGRARVASTRASRRSSTGRTS